MVFFIPVFYYIKFYFIYLTFFIWDQELHLLISTYRFLGAKSDWFNCSASAIELRFFCIEVFHP